MKAFKKLVALGLVMAFALSLVGCGAEKGEKIEGETGSKSETITFGTNAEFPPFEYVTGTGVIDQYDGIDMAIAKKIAEEAGFSMDIDTENAMLVKNQLMYEGLINSINQEFANLKSVMK